MEPAALNEFGFAPYGLGLRQNRSRHNGAVLKTGSAGRREGRGEGWGAGGGKGGEEGGGEESRQHIKQTVGTYSLEGRKGSGQKLSREPLLCCCCYRSC